MTKLSVNVNKLATLRNSRGKNTPDVVEAGRRILAWGAHGLTVHPRPDGRHIRTNDVTALSQVVREFNASAPADKNAEFNVEGYPSTEYLELVKEVLPDQATLVPDPPEALTSNAGWKISENEKFLTSVVAELHKNKVRVSLFVDPQTFGLKDAEALTRIGAERVELYTEAFADAFGTPEQKHAIGAYVRLAGLVTPRGVAMNAGHDLNQRNLEALIKAIPAIREVSIGHALISESLYDGLETTVRNYLRLLGWTSPSSPR